MVLNLTATRAKGYAVPMGVPYVQETTVAGAERAELEEGGLAAVLSQAPLTLRREDGTAYAFPIDPIINVSSKNIIVRRYVAKGALKGSVKESFSQDDYEITVSGILMGDTAEELNGMVAALRELCEAQETLGVECDMLVDGYGITKVVVESYQFPHTKGLENQNYTLKLYSDSSVNILEEV